MGSVLFFSRALDGRYLAAKAEEGRWQANISLAGSTAYLFGSTLYFEIPYNAYKTELLRVQNLKAMVREQVLPTEDAAEAEEEKKEDDRAADIKAQIRTLQAQMKDLQEGGNGNV